MYSRCNNRVALKQKNIIKQSFYLPHHSRSFFYCLLSSFTFITMYIMAAKICYTSALLSIIVLLAILDSRRIFTVAFIPATRRSQQHNSPEFTSSVIRTTTSSYASEASIVDILEDYEGHINPELAQRIWKWEKQQRLNLDLPDFQNYSTRAGLRWVKEMVEKTMRSSTVTSTTTATPNNLRRSLYDDLIQEGVIGLMTALKTFEQKSRPNESFESFAKAQIEFGLEAFTIEREKGMGTPTGKGKRHPLSMESTIEIADPLQTTTTFHNQDEWEIREGLLLDNGESVDDESLQYEGEDQMWIASQSVASPLRDSIPQIDDDEDSIMDGIFGDKNSNTSPDDIALTDMIFYNVDDFLGNTLDEIESQIIQMRYGLDDGVAKTQKEISYDLNLTIREVRKLQKLALNKLRAKFTERYVSDDTGHEDFWEDTV